MHKHHGFISFQGFPYITCNYSLIVYAFCLYNPFMIRTIFIIILSFAFPPLFMYLRSRFSFLRKINTIILCYVLGLIVGNTGLMNGETQNAVDTLASITAVLAIPLMLFSLNLLDWKKLAGKAGLSMLLASLSVLLVSFAAHLLFRNRIPRSWELAGLTIGVYTGGTPNLAAIRTALNIDLSRYLAIHTADMLWSALYLMLILGVGKKWIAPLLPGRNHKETSATSPEPVKHEEVLWDRNVLSKEKILPLLRNFLLALLLVGAGAWLSGFFPESLSTLGAILIITTLSLLFSFIHKVRVTEFSFQLGEYFIYVFCIAAGALGNIGELLSSAPVMILFVGFVLFGSFLLHVLFCRLTGIDGATMMCTSTSAICSPPFVPVVALSLDAPQLILPAISTGLIGYALGNYLGTLAAHLFSAL